MKRKNAKPGTIVQVKYSGQFVTVQYCDITKKGSICVRGKLGSYHYYPCELRKVKN